eukprot:TRINITY_DN20803_c0_g1_i1.p1 TRINITY_DN20803_c0_g1~~TRINITY_DN20803_c0_g1_i1.p1  ORF type:complete len:581 (+),score=170.92 TRINITY_DN20803_c0_g1_i1:69-1745(+)
MQSCLNQRIAPCKEKLMLACDIVTEHFGAVPGMVVKRLLFQGPSNLTQLAAACSSGFTHKGGASSLRRALIVLIHHGLVFYRNGAPPVYYCMPDAVLQRIRHPAMVLAAKERFGDDGAIITKLLLQHGRLTEPNLLEMILNDPSSPVSHLPDERMGKKKESLKATIQNMLQYYYVEYCPTNTVEVKAGEKLEGIAAYEAALKAKTKSKSRKREQEEEKPAKKSKTAKTLETDEDGWATVIAPTKSEKKSPSGGDVERQEGGVGEMESNSELRVNCVKFLQHMRNQEAVELVRRLVNEHAATVVSTYLMQGQRVSLSLPSDIETSMFCIPQFPRISQPAKPDAIQHLIPNAEVSRRLTDIIHTLENNISQLDHMSVMKKVSSSQGYAVNMDVVMQTVKATQIEFVLGKKFGTLARRIFKILLSKKILEEREIVAHALASEADVRHHLYRMKAAGYLAVRELPTTNDSNPNKTFYLWYIPIEDIQPRLLEEMYKTLRNLYQRRIHECKEVTPLLERTQKGGGHGLTEAESEKVAKWNSIQETIGFSVVSLYDSIAALEFF